MTEKILTETVDSIINNALYKGIKFVNIHKFVQQVKEKIVENSGELQIEKGWKLFEGITDPSAPTRILYDTNGYITPSNRNVCVLPIADSEEIKTIWKYLNNKQRKKVMAILAESKIMIEKPDNPLASQIIADAQVILRPIPKLKDPLKCIKQLDWPKFIDSLVEFKCYKDVRVKLIHKTHLLRGFVMELNNHTIFGTNPGVGKSSFYTIVGHRMDRVNSRAFLGFAKSPTEIYPGIVADQELPFTIDQVESQEAEDIFAYLNSATEQGFGTVGLGATSFTVECRCPFIFLANIQEYKGGTLQSFSSLIDQITLNTPAFLKRIGTIVYNNNLTPLKSKTGNLKEWKNRITFFRAVEESVLNRLRKIYNSEELWKWAHEEIEGYTKQVKEAVKDLSDIKVKNGLMEHANGAQCRIKTAAFNITVIEEIESIIKNQVNLNEMFKNTQKVYLKKLVAQNLESIRNITETWEEQKEKTKTDLYLHVFPNYVREVIIAVDQYEGIKPITMPLTSLGVNYACGFHVRWANVVQAWRDTKGSIIKYNPMLKRYYGIEIQRREHNQIWIKLV